MKVCNAYDDSFNNEQVYPFLKWAGGKRWLVDQYPEYFNFKFNRYIEPFLGGGAVFFRLAPRKAILADTNSELINTFNALKYDWFNVEKVLKKHQINHNKIYYYNIRDYKPRTNVNSAARFIYLNRTCWNGLYRVNYNGKFNVPIGTKSNVLLKTDNFKQISNMLSNASIVTSDFEETLNKARKDDFVFIDPPYTVKHNDNAFIKYNEGLFSWEDQIRLKNCISLAHKRGAKIIVTNAYHRCVKELYKGLGTHHKISRQSIIAGKSSARGLIEELLIKCI